MSSRSGAWRTFTFRHATGRQTPSGAAVRLHSTGSASRCRSRRAAVGGHLATIEALVLVVCPADGRDPDGAVPRTAPDPRSSRAAPRGAAARARGRRVPRAGGARVPRGAPRRARCAPRGRRARPRAALASARTRPRLSRTGSRPSGAAARSRLTRPASPKRATTSSSPSRSARRGSSPAPSPRRLRAAVPAPRPFPERSPCGPLPRCARSSSAGVDSGIKERRMPLKILVTAKRVEDPESKIKVKPDGVGDRHRGRELQDEPLRRDRRRGGAAAQGEARRRGGRRLDRRREVGDRDPRRARDGRRPRRSSCGTTGRSTRWSSRRSSRRSFERRSRTSSSSASSRSTTTRTRPASTSPSGSGCAPGDVRLEDREPRERGGAEEGSPGSRSPPTARRSRVVREVDGGVETLEVTLPGGGDDRPAAQQAALRVAPRDHEGEEEGAEGAPGRRARRGPRAEGGGEAARPSRRRARAA